MKVEINIIVMYCTVLYDHVDLLFICLVMLLTLEFLLTCAFELRD